MKEEEDWRRLMRAHDAERAREDTTHTIFALVILVFALGVAAWLVIP